MTLEEAVIMVQRHREGHPDAMYAAMFDRQIFDQILAQPALAGVRVYYAEHDNEAIALVLVGVDAQGNDLYEGYVGDHSEICPPMIGCATEDSPLLLTPRSSSQAPSSESAEAPRDHRITLAEGVAMVRRYTEGHPDAVRAERFDREIFDQILAQPGCAGVRFYYAEYSDGAPTLVLVGVDAQGNDLYQGYVGGVGHLCPPHCDTEDSPFLQ